MKQIRLILVTSILLLAFSTVIYTSCKKDPCNGVTCQNGGSCSNGNCICPTGFSGSQCENTTLIYVNDTYTPVYASLGGVNQTIPVGGSVFYTGTAGSNVAFTAYTYGLNTSGDQVGDRYSWSFSDNFSVDGSVVSEYLDVHPTYFYLYMRNNDASQSVTSIAVNYGNSTYQRTDDIGIPNNGSLYGIGYYPIFNSTEIYVTGSAGNVWTTYPYAFTPNIANCTDTMNLN